MGCFCVAASSLLAQNGDKAGEAQNARIAPEKIPSSPQLSPIESMKTFKLPPGYEVQLVASEPMIEAPIAAQFDPDGRLYVLEMRGFMRTPDAEGEDQPTGRISILEDTDGDGRMDKSTVFLDGLVMPRAMALTQGGVLLGEPPKLWFCRDVNGDGKADEKVELFNDYGDRKNPEHTANGLVLAMDNWFYNLYHTWRYRWRDGRWERQPIPNRVQWGLSQDDYGRLFFTQNSDPLRADLYSSSYAGRAPTARVNFLNRLVAPVFTTWPGKITAGVNRGYQPDVLRADGSLASFTAACGTVIYRGDNFPAAAENQAFICEPSANMIRWQNIHDEDGQLTSENAFDKSEFFTSSDERFRPVNLLNAPDGALYVVDFGRGIIQHRIYMTSYLRKQVELRGLAAPLEVGRIYRVVRKGGPLTPRPQLLRAPSSELAKRLSHPNGWWRDTAQRLLVERRDTSVVPELRKLALGNGDPRFRLHALWTLEGMGQVTPELAAAAIRDGNPKLRVTGLRLAEAVLERRPPAPAEDPLLAAMLEALRFGSTQVRVQAALSLGMVRTNTTAHAGLREAYETTGSEWVKQATALGMGLLDPQTNTLNSAQLAGLSSDDLRKFKNGKELYMMSCAACHQPHGLGQEGLAPPLVGSEWVGYSTERLTRIVLHGVRGPLKVKGQTYQLEMPPLSVFSDEQVAQVLTYVRREWGHAFPTVEPETVKSVRAITAQREQAWTELELLRIP
ncbi:MAG: c-type cytochrome [Verrucomicrobia bacterium]|nr:c-type cytochrome [Verrucomicrobiota bacterium]